MGCGPSRMMSSRRRGYGYNAGPTHVVHHSPRPMMGGYGGGGMRMGGGRCPPPRRGYGGGGGGFGRRGRC